MDEFTRLFNVRYSIPKQAPKKAPKQPKLFKDQLSTALQAKYLKKPEPPKETKIFPVQVDFPLPKIFQGVENRINEANNFVVPENFIQRRNPQYLVGKILRIDHILANYQKYIDQDVVVAGWANSVRLQANNTILFIQLVDGTSALGLQIVVSNAISNFEDLKQSKKSYSFRIRGKLIKSLGKGQVVQVSITGTQNQFVKILGRCDDPKYPLAGKYFTPQYLRDVAHLRVRTALISSVARVKNSLAYATHLFFQNNGFIYVKTPLITASDCEGAGQMFQVTTILPQSGLIKDIPQVEGKIDYRSEFFKKSANLTVSGQLAVENYCCGLSNVYTFGPTFRAQVSHTTRHIAQFWMIEPELAFADVFDVMECAEAYIKYCIEFVLKNNLQDLKFFESKVKKELINYLKNVTAGPFARASYTEAIQILLNVIKKGVVFQNQVKWGVDLASEHEKYLCDHIFHRPTILYNYPKDIKAFYMRQNEDGKTVASFDVLAPEIGEIVGGSQRQQRLDILENRIDELKLKKENYWWYLDLRRYGTVPHGGFGLGFERLVMMCTGIENIRDVVPFPRTPGNAEF